MAVCSFMGLPWYVAATVISIAHIDSLKMESESSAPGEQPQFLGVRWDRHRLLVCGLSLTSFLTGSVHKSQVFPLITAIYYKMVIGSGLLRHFTDSIVRKSNLHEEAVHIYIWIVINLHGAHAKPQNVAVNHLDKVENAEIYLCTLFDVNQALAISIMFLKSTSSTNNTYDHKLPLLLFSIVKHK